ncbi:MAG: NADH-quinone oxidoreductase subunit NuoG [Candidatus Polarisedimenticolaceae bacterium]|nr:NADH-quinone oxidoreductase subunit NuoG [Candidatus Polarisedimenticolaceae bacterium]
MTDELVTIEVDGRELKAKPGTMLIDVTDAAGINIPRFCYHKKLSVSANCRMCLVEVEKVPKPLPACCTPVNEGMKVSTRSPMALGAQKGTMEFLLINHPLDCPICDQGGECELQDVAVGYGSDVSRYSEAKRVVPQRDIGPLIATDFTRCIHCTRCVRFGAEIAGVRELGATGRGEHMTIGTFVEKSVDSEMSGNVIDLCPVGSLTAKPSRYKARAWELTQHDSVAPHDSVGSNIHVHTRNNRVVRVHPKENESINEIWLSDRDRFSYEGLNSEDRLTQPMVRKNGEWQEVEWQEALEFAVKGLQSAAGSDGDQLATLVSANSTLEELYLAQKLTRGMDSGNIDHRLRQSDFRLDGNDSPVPGLGITIQGIESLDAALLVGSNVRKEQPIIAHRLRKAAKSGAKVSFINPLWIDLHFEADQFVSTPAVMVDNLASIAKAASAKLTGNLAKLVKAAEVSETAKSVAEQLKSANNGVIMLGNQAAAHPDYSLLVVLASAIAEATNTSLSYIPALSNSVGAALAGALPHRGPAASLVEKCGANAQMMQSKPRKAYLLMGAEPGFDFWDPSLINSALDQAECVVALTAYHSESLASCADVMLPIAGFAETSGTLVNAEGTWQSFNGLVKPQGDARPAWKVLRVLGNLLDIDGFDQNSSDDVLEELKSHAAETAIDNSVSTKTAGELNSSTEGLYRIGDVPMYASDALVRRASSLQRTNSAEPAAVRLSANQAKSSDVEEEETLVVVQDGNRAQLPLIIDPRVPDGAVWISSALPGTEKLGGQFGVVTLEKA